MCEHFLFSIDCAIRHFLSIVVGGCTRINSYIYLLIIKCAVSGRSRIKSLMGQSGPLCSDKSEGECRTLLECWTDQVKHKLLYQMTDCSYDCLDRNKTRPNINLSGSQA